MLKDLKILISVIMVLMLLSLKHKFKDNDINYDLCLKAIH